MLYNDSNETFDRKEKKGIYRVLTSIIPKVTNPSLKKQLEVIKGNLNKSRFYKNSVELKSTVISVFTAYQGKENTKTDRDNSKSVQRVFEDEFDKVINLILSENKFSIDLGMNDDDGNGSSSVNQVNNKMKSNVNAKEIDPKVVVEETLNKRSLRRRNEKVVNRKNRSDEMKADGTITSDGNDCVALKRSKGKKCIEDEESFVEKSGGRRKGRVGEKNTNREPKTKTNRKLNDDQDKSKEKKKKEKKDKKTHSDKVLQKPEPSSDKNMLVDKEMNTSREEDIFKENYEGKGDQFKLNLESEGVVTEDIEDEKCTNKAKRNRIAKTITKSKGADPLKEDNPKKRIRRNKKESENKENVKETIVNGKRDRKKVENPLIQSSSNSSGEAIPLKRRRFRKPKPDQHAILELGNLATQLRAKDIYDLVQLIQKTNKNLFYTDCGNDDILMINLQQINLELYSQMKELISTRLGIEKMTIDK